MNEHKIQPKTIRSYVNCISGLFITRENQNGLTPTECNLITALLHVLPTGGNITREVKVKVADMTNSKLQVVTNYITKFKDKGVVVNKQLHPVFYKTVIIERGNGQGNS